VSARFSKANMLDGLRRDAERLRERWGFDPGNGTVQLRTIQPKEDLIEAAVAYGQWRGIQRIIDDIQGGYLGYGDDR
jgi:hypothetical protein